MSGDAGLRHAVGLALRSAGFAASRYGDRVCPAFPGQRLFAHSIEAASILCGGGGINDPIVIAGAVLHHVLEDTATTPNELRSAFGDDIKELVLEVSCDTSIPLERRIERYAETAASLSSHARLVRIADMVVSVVHLAVDPPSAWDKSEKLDYLEWTKRVVDRLGSTNEVLDRRFWFFYNEAYESALQSQ